MNKEISTPRIEEMAKDFCKNTPRMKQEGGVTFYNRLVVVLTEAHQAGIRDAFRVGYLAGQGHKEPSEAYEEFIKALQDNKHV